MGCGVDMFCKHEWTKMHEETIVGRFGTKHIVIFVCKKCGKIKKFTETS